MVRKLFLGFAACMFAFGSIASRPSATFSQELRPVASTFTVRVDAPGGGDGSGTLIARDGNTYYVLTSWHVVDKTVSYVVRTYDFRDYIVEPESIQRLSNYDLAILSFNSLNDYELASFDGEAISLGQPISISGWLNPQRDITTDTYQFISGSMTGRAYEDNGYSLVFSTSGAFTGMSGGPILDEENKVVGVIGRGARDRFGSPNGLYLGIPISALLSSSYAQHIQPNQFSAPAQRYPGALYPRQGETPDITVPNTIYVPRQGDPPAISR